MAEFNQFGSAQPTQSGETEHCAQCEAMLADALDGTLSPADQAMFNLHMASCSTCSAMLADAQRGADWLEMLKTPRPEPSAALLERILAQTCNAQPDARSAHQPQLVAGKQQAGHGLWQPSTILGHSGMAASATMRGATYAPTNVLPFRSRLAAGFRLRSIGQTLLQPRLAMTAAMAFFSIALTLNITGVRLSQLRVGDLRPTSIKRNITNANASVHRYYDNLKVVYELESRVRDLQRSSNDTDQYSLPSNQSAPAAPQQNEQPQPTKQQPAAEKPDSRQSRPKPGPGSSRRETHNGNVQFADLLQRPTPVPATQAFVVFTPSVLKYLQEGEHV